MVYVSRAEGGYGIGASVIRNDSAHNSVLVPDAELLVSGAYHRAGPDLVLTSPDGRHFIVPGYFSSEHPPALVAPNGMTLSGDMVGLLAGSPTPGEYAQAQPGMPADGIGKIEKAVGDVTAIRNGVAVTLTVGDAVYKSDVIQTGTSSSVGISFPDGTALNLVANTRMGLNDYNYNPSSNSNDALFTLVEGTFAFVAGKVAHTGDMKISTPVATMGIRGTTGVVEEEVANISASQSGVTYSFSVVTDFGTGVAGLYDLVDANGNVIATVSQTGYVTYLTPQGLNRPPLVSVAPITDSQFAVEQGILQQLFETLNPINQNNNNSNGSSSPPPPPQNPFPQLIENGPTTITVGSNGSNPITTITTNPVVTGPPGPNRIVSWIGNTGGSWDNAGNWSDNGYIPTNYSVVEILVPVTVTITQAESANGLQLALGATLEIENNGSLALNNAIIGAGTLELNASGSDPTLFINGAVTLTGGISEPGSSLLLPGGTILLAGSPSSDDLIAGVPKTGAVLTNVNFTIMGAGQIGQGDGNLTLINESGGVIDATGLLVVNTGNQVANAGLIEATAGGTLQIDDSVSNTGTIESIGDGALVEMANTTFDNFGGVIASQGAINFTGLIFTNEAGASVDATLSGTILFSGGSVTNASSIQADSSGDVTFSGASVTNQNGATIDAISGGTVTFNGGSAVNSGTVEATDGGILQVENLDLQNSAGTISVDSTSTFDLDNATITGGIIDNAGDAVVTGTSEIDGATVENSGMVTVGAGASLTLQATTLLANQASGTIDAAGGSVTINFDNAGDSNAGTIKSDNGTVVINLNVSGDVNDGTIEALSGGNVTININEDGSSNHGVIKAAGDGSSVTFDKGGVEEAAVQTGNGNGGGNYGTIEATNGGEVWFNSGLDNYNVVEAAAGGTVNLGAANNYGTGTIESTGTDSTVNFSDGNLTNSNLIIAENGGAISLSSEMLTNSSGGTVEASGSGSSISWNTGGVTNDSGAVIEADTSGSITFDGSIGIQNEGGKIEALSGGSILFETTGTGSVANDGGTIEASGTGSTITFASSLTGAQNDQNGVIEALNGGTVTIDGFAGENALANAGGTIEAVGANSSVQLSGADIIGGTLQTSDGGIIENVSGTSTLSGVTIAGGSVLQSDSDTAIDLAGLTTLAAGTVTFEGGGTFTLSGGSIVGAPTGGGELDNHVTIAGHGQIGNNGATNLDFTNERTVNANDSGQTLTLETANYYVDNTGTLEATGGGILDILNDVNGGGTIAAYGNGSTVQIGSSVNIGSIGGAFLKTGNRYSSSGGMIEILAPLAGFSFVIFDGSAHAVTVDGYVQVDSGATLAFDGAIVNEGTIVLSSSYSDASSGLIIQSNVNLDGHGEIVLAAGGGNAIVSNGSAVTLTNMANTIFGAGTVGDANLTFDNQGIVNANVSDGILTIDTGSNFIINSGTLEATAGGTLAIASNLENSGLVLASQGGTVSITDSAVDNAGGTISAVGPNSAVELFNATIYGGTLSTSNHGVIEIAAAGGNNTSELVGGVVTGHHSVNVSAFSSTDDVGNGPTTNPNDWQASHIYLTAGEQITISASGAVQIGTGVVIDGQNVSSETPAGDPSLTTSDAGNPSFLAPGLVPWSLIGTIGNSGTAFEIGDGATFTATTSGELYLAINDNIYSDNSSHWNVTATTAATPLVNDGTVEVDAGANLALSGAIDNEGAIDITSGTYCDPSSLVIDGVVALDGAGQIVLGGRYDGIFGDGESHSTLYNASTIDGAGAIGSADAPFALVNQTGGVIDANAFGTLTIDTGDLGVTNTGLLEAINGGHLDIHSDVYNAGGTIAAVCSGSEVNLCGVTIAGGTLSTSGDGVIDVTSTGTVFDGSSDGALTVAGNVQVVADGESDSSLGLAGNIDFADGGTITLAFEAGSGGAGLGDPDLVVENTVSLDGDSGGVVLSGSDDHIVGGSRHAELDNSSTLSGAGSIGGGLTEGDSLQLDNQAGGVIDANDSGQTLTINTNGSLTNEGTLEASNGGTLLIDNAVANSGDGHALIEGGTLDFANASNVDAITFNNGGGTNYGDIIFGNQSSLNGLSATINGFAGTAPGLQTSDGIDLAGHWTIESQRESHGNLVVSLQDGHERATLTFDDFSGSLNVASDHNGGTLITDPPAASTGHGVSFTQDQIHLSENNASSNSAQNTPTPSGGGQSGSVSIGGTGNDHFVFHQAQFTETNLNANQPSTPLSEHAGDHNTQLAALVTHDAVFQPAFDPVHDDAATAQFHQIVASAGHLH